MDFEQEYAFKKKKKVETIQRDSHEILVRHSHEISSIFFNLN